MQIFSERSISICTISIFNFVSLCERNESIQIFDLLNKNYFPFIHSAAIKSHGIIDKPIADRQTIIWSSKNEINNALSACISALDILISHKNMKKYIPINQAYDLKICITTGKCTIADNPNLFMGEICNYNISLLYNIINYGIEIIIDDKTNECIHKKFHTRELDEIKNGNKISKIFELIDKI